MGFLVPLIIQKSRGYRTEPFLEVDLRLPVLSNWYDNSTGFRLVIRR